MKFQCVSVAVVVLVTSTASAQQAVQWRVEDGGNGHWYQFREMSSSSWTAHLDASRAIGGHLVTLTSSAENSFVEALLPTVVPGGGQGYLYGPSIGLYQPPGNSEPSGGWRWVTDEALSFSQWFPGEPNDFASNGEHWARMRFSGSTFGWNDTVEALPNSDLPFHPLVTSAIIEWSADCNDDGIVDYGQILNGQLLDTNGDGVPDVCEVDPCPADINGNGVVNGVDLAAVLCTWGTDGDSEGGADINNDGIVNGVDLAFVLGAWGPCVTTPAWATVIEVAPDPAIVTSSALRAAISATGLPWRVRDTATQIELVLIPSGTFQMGCSPSLQYGCHENETPVHPVTLTQPFYMGRYEVTQAQWTASMGSNPSSFQSPSAEVPGLQVPNRPVERVSWNMIQGFLSATGMRLPTEAEWEYAYRADTTTAFHPMPGYPNGTNDDSLLGTIAWFSSNSASQTRPVGQLAGNGFGLHDMSGNVWEWVNDWYGENYYVSSPPVNPQGPSSGFFRMLRGGSWYDFSNYCRSSKRLYGSPADDDDDIVGFRVARNP